MNQDLQYLKQLDNWSEKYEFILDLGQKIPTINLNLRTNDNRIVGCQSRVWLILNWKNDLLQIEAEADSRLVKGLLALTILTYRFKRKVEIKQIGSSWLQELELDQHLSLIRRQGLQAVINTILNFANQ
jgi:cysteine desulfuration protein SufE